MRQEMIVPSLVRRLSQPVHLVLALVVGGLFCLLRILGGGPGISTEELALPFVLVMGHLALDPIPWQWTADSEGRLRIGRGLLLGLCLNGLWLAPILWLRSAHRERMVPPEPPMQLRGPGDPGPRRHHPFHPELGFGMLNLALATLVGWTLASKEVLEGREQRMAELLRRSRSRALRNQLDPHVLYNALSSLSELVYEDPLAAEDVITRLADLYRMLTVHGHEDLVSLAEERRLVEAYLAMEQMRLGDRLQVAWNWPAWANEVWMPPLLLQPLVENAIKHGISPSDQGGCLEVHCGREGRDVVLQVCNGGRGLSTPRVEGTGIRNLKARLELAGCGGFQLEQVGGLTQATLRWPGGGEA